MCIYSRQYLTSFNCFSRMVTQASVDLAMKESILCDLNLDDLFPDFPMQSPESDTDIRELEALVCSIRDGSSASEDELKAAAGEYILYIIYTYYIYMLHVVTYIAVGYVTKTCNII